jgi:diguanylate cyclase (GGDEF)-like protein
MDYKNKITSGGEVRKYMTSPIPSVVEGTTLKEVAEFMRSHKTPVVLVQNKALDYIGVVTDADFTRKVAANEGSVYTAKVESIMSSPIKTIKGSTVMAEANKVMHQSRISHLAITEKGEFTGLLSVVNFFKYYENVEDYLSDLAINDGLTGIYNRRYFDEVLTTEWKRAKREKLPLSLVMLDIDYFKKYNDTYGHQAGDECLVKIAISIADTLQRPADMVARYGGEEFVVILPNAEQEDAAKFSEKIRANIENLNIEHKASNINRFVTASFGVASVVPNLNSSCEELLQNADKALYNAKHEGRNCVSVSQD